MTKMVESATIDFAQASGMVPEESSGRRGGEDTGHGVLELSGAHATNGACAINGPPAGVVPGQAASVLSGKEQAETYSRREKLYAEWLKLQSQGMTRRAAAIALGTSNSALSRLVQAVEANGKAAFASNRHLCGRKPNYLPSEAELACVRDIYLRLDESEARGRGLGSSKVTAFRVAAKSDDTRISDAFRRIVLQRRKKGLPPSWERLIETPASVIDAVRDARSTMAVYVTTPRGRTWVNEVGQELPLRAGTILEADDGTLGFYAHIQWPFGGDKCSDKYGVKLGRWQLLAAVDARWEFCCAFDIVARNLSSYRGEDSGALLGRTMLEVAKPELWRLERGSWESNFVREALQLCQVPVINAWHSKQKSAVERFFDRLWTPASLIQGHVGRDRGRFKSLTDLASACQDGRRDPREHFLSFDEAANRLIGAVQFINSEPIQSKTWGSWVPQERFEAQASTLQKLDPALKIFFSREQREWIVRGAVVGGSVEGPLIKFPVHFQCPELWEFEGCRVRCYFDPYTDPVLGTIVLQDEWRSAKPGHIIARDVPALQLPPQAVLARDWTNESREKSLAIRKAIGKAVRTECWNWVDGAANGKRTSQARDGLGNVATIDNPGAQPAAAQPEKAPPRFFSRPDEESRRTQANTFSQMAAIARQLQQEINP